MSKALPRTTRRETLPCATTKPDLTSPVSRRPCISAGIRARANPCPGKSENTSRGRSRPYKQCRTQCRTLRRPPRQIPQPLYQRLPPWHRPLPQSTSTRATKATRCRPSLQRRQARQRKLPRTHAAPYPRSRLPRTLHESTIRSHQARITLNPHTREETHGQAYREDTIRSSCQEGCNGGNGPQQDARDENASRYRKEGARKEVRGRRT